MTKHSTITLTFDLPLDVNSKELPDEITPDFLESCKFGYNRDTGFWYRHLIGVTVLVYESDSGCWSLSIVSIHSSVDDWAYHKETIRVSALPAHLLMLLGTCQWPCGTETAMNVERAKPKMSIHEIAKRGGIDTTDIQGEDIDVLTGKRTHNE